ncbi:MAG: FAD-binding oxidoreductase, partial [Chloroflexi bacterium]|nr:FAD-binding oxidoreductase [Chloroflexota bacterium]
IENLDEAQTSVIWRKLADFGWDEATTPLMTGRVSVLPSKISSLVKAIEQAADDSSFRPAIVCHPGYGTVLINWFADEDNVSDDTAANVLEQARDAVHMEEGRMIIERCPADVKARFDVWDDVGEPLLTMRRLKEQYDPKGILNPGRFVGGI